MENGLRVTDLLSYLKSIDDMASKTVNLIKFKLYLPSRGDQRPESKVNL